MRVRFVESPPMGRRPASRAAPSGIDGPQTTSLASPRRVWAAGRAGPVRIPSMITAMTVVRMNKSVSTHPDTSLQPADCHKPAGPDLTFSGGISMLLSRLLTGKEHLGRPRKSSWRVDFALDLGVLESVY